MINLKFSAHIYAHFGYIYIFIYIYIKLTCLNQCLIPLLSLNQHQHSTTSVYILYKKNPSCQ